MIGSVDGPGPGAAPPPRLTRRAVMRAALPDHDPADRRAAHRAWLPATLVNPEVILEVAAAVDPVDAGAVVGPADAEGARPAEPRTPGSAPPGQARAAGGPDRRAGTPFRTCGRRRTAGPIRRQ